MLISIKHKEVIPLPILFRFVLKFVYEEENMSFEDIRWMQESIVNWNKKIQLDEEMERANEEEQYQLMMMGDMLYKNSKGEFDERKRSFKENKIDYRKFHRLPEAYTKEDVIEGFKIQQKIKEREDRGIY